MATRRCVLAMFYAIVSLTMLACSLSGSVLQPALIAKGLGERGYTNSDVTITHQSREGVSADTLTVTVDRPQNASSDDQAGAAVASFVIEQYPNIQNVELLVVVLRSAGEERRLSRSPQEWRDFVAVLDQPPGIANAVTARGSFGEKYEPRDITDDFPADQPVFHVIVSTRNLPAGSLVRAVWIAVDTHGDGQPNRTMTRTEALVEGTRNVDFVLEPTAGRLPPGAYQVDIHLGDRLERSLPFTVAGG
ncbi:MAG: hypothetical protein AB7P40_12325 [Chloroflexota bacterium]